MLVYDLRGARQWRYPYRFAYPGQRQDIFCLVVIPTFLAAYPLRLMSSKTGNLYGKAEAMSIRNEGANVDVS